MKICIASVHTQCKLSRLWRDLQWQFLKETTTSRFEYHIIANALDPKPFEKHTMGVLHISTKSSHFICIKEILSIFDASTCTHCLLLDSDCWPIRNGWDILLAKQFVSIDSLLVPPYKFTAPVRTENLDVFPHPSAVFFPKTSLPNLDFGFALSIDLLGKSNSDVGSAMGMESCYPLMKTNYISPHPVYASIYGDCFYHHCAGSRGTGIRCANYYRHMITMQQQKKIYSKVTEQLQKRPKSFINQLRGTRSRTQNLAIDI